MTDNEKTIAGVVTLSPFTAHMSASVNTAVLPDKTLIGVASQSQTIQTPSATSGHKYTLTVLSDYWEAFYPYTGVEAWRHKQDEYQWFYFSLTVNGQVLGPRITTADLTVNGSGFASLSMKVYSYGSSNESRNFPLITELSVSCYASDTSAIKNGEIIIDLHK